MGEQYEINQCPLYKIGSKSRLARILECTTATLKKLTGEKQSYRKFLLPETVCPYTGKKRKERFVHEPVGDLRRVHERLQDLLMRVCPPGYAHAAVKGRSYKSNAEQHMSSRCVATFDITNFYPKTSRHILFRFFLDQLKCPADIAWMLTDISSSGSGMPTGSPLSPVLSLFANKPLFDGLHQLALDHGLSFTCYVDDITFSGASIPIALPRRVKSVVERHGHQLADKKTRLFLDGQPKHVTGVVLLDGKITVPHSRFQKARKIHKALLLEDDLVQQRKIAQQLSGLLGEAAHLESTYKPWAMASYQRLKVLNKLFEKVRGPIITTGKVSVKKLSAADMTGLPF